MTRKVPFKSNSLLLSLNSELEGGTFFVVCVIELKAWGDQFISYAQFHNLVNVAASGFDTSYHHIQPYISAGMQLFMLLDLYGLKG